MYYSNSNMYEGEWKKDARDGYGELFYSDGGYYKGFWRDDKRNGYGENTYNNKKFEVGQWVNNQFQKKSLFSSLFSYQLIYRLSEKIYMESNFSTIILKNRKKSLKSFYYELYLF